MPATVEKLPDEPIIIVTVEGQLDGDMARGVYAQIAELTKDITGPIYRITDVRKQVTNFADNMAVVKEGSQTGSGTTADPRITNIFVGRENVSPVTLAVMRRKNPGTHGVLNTVEEALNYVRWQIKLQNEDSST